MHTRFPLLARYTLPLLIIGLALPLTLLQTAQAAESEEYTESSETAKETTETTETKLGKDISFTERIFRKPKDFFKRSEGGKKLARHYESFDKHQDNIAVDLLSNEEQRAIQLNRADKRLVDDIVDYEPSTHSARVWVPESYTEDEMGDWGIFLYVSGSDTPDVPPALQKSLEENKLIFATPNGAGSSQPDLLRMALILDTLHLVQETYPKLDKRKLLVYGEDEAGQMALLTVMNFADYFKYAGVMPVNATLIVGWRHVAGHVAKSSKKTGFRGRDQNDDDEDEKDTVFHPLSAPYLGTKELSAMDKRKVKIMFILTNKKAIKQVMTHFDDWRKYSGNKKLRPFWFPDGITAEGLKLLVDYASGKRVKWDTFALPEEMMPEKIKNPRL